MVMELAAETVIHNFNVFRRCKFKAARYTKSSNRAERQKQEGI